MPLTPSDVANKLFGKEFRGYAMDAVDAFLDEVEGELTRLLTENSLLARGVAAAPVPAAPQLPVAQPLPPAQPVPFVQPTLAAAIAPGETQEAALRTLLMAQRTADQAIAEARAEADVMVGQARTRAQQINLEVDARSAAVLDELQGRRRELESRIEDLRAFEREYRLRLKAYLESQLNELDSRVVGTDDAGVGVPAAARAAAVGVMPAGVVDSMAARPPALPTTRAVPPAAPAAPQSAPLAAPPREAVPPRPGSELPTEPEPVGPFTVVPPPLQVEDGRERPTLG